MGGEGQAKELYVLADLSVVEADLAVPVADLGSIREKQRARLITADGRGFDGAIVFVNAMITPETRTGHVIASFPNADFRLHPGSLLNAEIALERTAVKTKVPRSALQMINGERIVFVRTPDGFVSRKVEVGAGDDDSVEILSGLTPGERDCSLEHLRSQGGTGKKRHPRGVTATFMFKQIISFSVHQRWLIVLLTALVSAFGVWSLTRLPIDAVPDITNNQVQINTLAPSLSANEIEKQITYPIENALAGIPGLEFTRSLSRNGFSQVTAVFGEKLDIFFARQQVNERLMAAKEEFPPGVEVRMGPIATGLSEIYMWTVRYQEPGVAISFATANRAGRAMEAI